MIKFLLYVECGQYSVCVMPRYIDQSCVPLFTVSKYALEGQGDDESSNAFCDFHITNMSNASHKILLSSYLIE